MLQFYKRTTFRSKQTKNNFWQRLMSFSTEGGLKDPSYYNVYPCAPHNMTIIYIDKLNKRLLFCGVSYFIRIGARIVFQEIHMVMTVIFVLPTCFRSENKNSYILRDHLPQLSRVNVGSGLLYLRRNSTEQNKQWWNSSPQRITWCWEVGMIETGESFLQFIQQSISKRNSF